ncbi:MAG: tungsten formylmethanofuran dehydrogenase [Bacteroidetes bacterium]|nr:MAG: tungsten formylmethanofuran dehydrogenase [Bacteroidota bacterium]
MSTSPNIDKTILSQALLEKAYSLMCTAAAMSDLYEERKTMTAKYVHATARGHEAIQLALGMQLRPVDFVSPYYRDDALLLGLGMTPYELMLQLFAKRDDPFSGGRTYYAHPSLRREHMPKIPHQSSSTGMQAIPATGVAQGIQYRERQGLLSPAERETPPVSVCSIGDGAMTEGEVAEALQMAALHQYPVLYLVQDNGWGISARGEEMYAQDAAAFAAGFAGIEVREVDGTDFVACYQLLAEVLDLMRQERRPFLIHARVPLLSHHTSGVRREWYRTDLEAHQTRDPLPQLAATLKAQGLGADALKETQDRCRAAVVEALEQAHQAEDPRPEEDLHTFIYAPTPVTEEAGEREPAGAEPVVMVDAALHAVDRILAEFPESLLYGQDVGGELGGVFREAALLAKRYGDQRVFNTPIQEGYIIGSTVGMSAVGCKPIVEVQFADYFWPGFNQLFAEVSRSYYLSHGKWPVQALIRVPIGAYGSGGPFHSSSIESTLLTVRGTKVVYPSNAADMKGLLRAAFLDPNPVILLEHKGLYWSKVPGSKAARCVEPSDDYVVPLGKARTFLAADPAKVETGETVLVVTYGMGVHWTLQAAEQLPGQVEILDLRSLEPLDWPAIEAGVKAHNRVMVLTEESWRNSFAESLAGRIGSRCFTWLDAPVQVMGAENTPAIPLNSDLEAAMLPNGAKLTQRLQALLAW